MSKHLPMAIEPSIPFNQCQFKLFKVDKNSLFCRDLLIEVNHKLIESTIAYFLGLDITKVEAMAVTNIDLNYAYARNRMFGLTLEQVQHLFATTHNAVANKYKPILSELIETQILPLFNDTTKHDDFKKEIDVNIIATNQPLTMSSLEIAELCDKQHKDVLYDIRNMLNQLEIGVAEFSATYVHPQNKQTYECFNLNKELSLTLVAGYNVKLRHKIILRWQELENATTPQIEYNSALKLLGVPEQIVPVIAKVYEERDEAIAKRHLLDDKRTATAMATAANLSIENKKLKAQLNKSYDYATIRTVEKFVKGVVLKWRALKKYCEERKLPILDVPDPLHGTIKSYPAEAWDKVYGVKLNDILKGK